MNTTVSWRAQLRRALTFLAPFRLASLCILALALLGAALGALEPVALMRLIDNLAEPSGMRGLVAWLLALLGIGLARELVGSISNWLSWRVRLSVQHGLLEATVARLHALPVAYHRGEKVGAMLTRLDRGISGFVGALSEIVTNVLPALAYLAIACVVMIRLDWRLSLVVLAFTPLPALIGAFAAREQAEREHLLLERWAEIYSRFNEVLSGIVTVKSYTMEEDEKHRFLDGVSAANATVIRRTHHVHRGAPAGNGGRCGPHPRAQGRADRAAGDACVAGVERRVLCGAGASADARACSGCLN